MRVALVHDDLVQWGGAERILLGLCEIFPTAPIYTSLFNNKNILLTQQFKNKKIVTSFLQNIPGSLKMYKLLLPLYPLAFEQFDFSNFDLVISHTTRFAKSIITKPHTKHICFCHTPPRFLWHFSGINSFGPAEILLSKLRFYDQVSAHRVDYFLAGSENAKIRVKKIYKTDSKVIYPFIDLERFKNIESFDGGYYLVIGRLNWYKRVDMAVKACIDMGVLLKVVGDGPQFQALLKIEDRKNLVKLLGFVDEHVLVTLLAGCKALIIPGIEDFGLTSLEAQALGKPVIAFSSGGSLETVLDGKSGLLFSEQNVDSLKEAMQKLDVINIDPSVCKKNARNFSKEHFIENFRQIVASLV